MELKLKLIPKNKKGNKIHIKPENKGKFTEYCGGKVTLECIQKGKRSNNAAVRKRATFAANARKWKKKHQEGGPIILEDEYLNPENLYTLHWYSPQHELGITPGLRGMMKARMAIDSHFGNPTARRMTNYDTRTYTFPEYIIPGNPIEGPAKGNVFVGNMGHVVIPGIKDVNGTLSYVDDWYALPDQNMYFDSNRDADIFARNYKEVAPMMLLLDGPFMYNQNEQLKNPVYESPKTWFDYWYENRPKEIYEGNQAYASLYRLLPFDEIMYGSTNPFDITAPSQLENMRFTKSYIVPQKYMDNITGINGVAGYSPYEENNTYYIPLAFEDFPLLIHEHAHKLRNLPHYIPQLKLILIWLLTKDPKYIYNLGIEPDYKYLDDADEIYARLMESRRRNNLDPRYILNINDILEMRKNPENSDLFDRYTDLFLLDLYNNIY